MQYALLFAEAPEDFAKRKNPATAESYLGAWMAYMGAMQQAGILQGGHGLEPTALATTLRVRDGARDVQDGPFADSKEQLGGLVVIEVPDLDAALEWAARCPVVSTGAVEVRPVMPPPPR
jgi:hypothetical protein